jgi:predicted protein tyrosine phosphatase
MTYTFSCPKCGEEIEADVDVGEHMVDWAKEILAMQHFEKKTLPPRCQTVKIKPTPKAKP